MIADTSLFDKGILSNFNKARRKLIEFAQKYFPESVKNRETGKEIGISRRGLDKFLSGNILYEKYASGFHIPELIENAHKTNEAENYHTETVGTIPTFEYYNSPIEIDGKMYTAHIRVKNTNMGDKYYGHTVSEIDDIKIEPPTRTYIPNNSAGQPENTGDSIDNLNIARGAETVKVQYTPAGAEKPSAAVEAQAEHQRRLDKAVNLLLGRTAGYEATLPLKTAAGQGIMETQRTAPPDEKGGSKTLLGKTPDEISNMTRKQLEDSIPDGWDFQNHNGRIHIKDANGKFRVRIDPPDKVTEYTHIHVFDENENPLDALGNVVSRKDLAGHIPYND